MNMNQPWVILSVLMASVFAMPAQADFEVMDQSSPPTEYGSTEYGNAQTGSFHRAITGGSQLTPAEQASLSKLLPEKDYDRYYGRIRLNFSTLSLDELKNSSTGSDAPGSINKKRTTANQTGLEIAVGYSWSQNFRGDIEYLVNKNLNYLASPVLIGAGVTARQLNAQIKNNTLLANLYYEFGGLNRFKPYLTAGAGFSVNSVQATLTPGGANTQRSLGAAWALGGGFRIGISSRWFLDASYRYIRLGTGMKIQPNSSFKLVGTTSMSALSLGFMYLF